MSIQYFPVDEHGMPYWIAYDPTFQDIEDMIYEVGRVDWYNFVVVGVPCEISPQWVAKHEGYVEGNYEYAVSYSIYKDDFTDMLEYEDADDVTDMFNYYLEGSGWSNLPATCLKGMNMKFLVERTSNFNLKSQPHKATRQGKDGYWYVDIPSIAALVAFQKLVENELVIKTGQYLGMPHQMIIEIYDAERE